MRIRENLGNVTNQYQIGLKVYEMSKIYKKKKNKAALDNVTFGVDK